MKRLVIFLVALVLLLAGCAREASPGSVTTAPEKNGQTDVPQTTADTAPFQEATAQAGLAEAFAPDFTFTTTDRDGNEWTEDCFAACKLTILNFWEPWCGPCVGEMPDLQKISEAYADQGLQVIGIYQTPNVEDDVRQVLAGAGITYPILHYTSAFDSLQTGYVPTTVFVDQQGKIVVQPFAGSMDYDGWAEMVEENLK